MSVPFFSWISLLVVRSPREPKRLQPIVQLSRRLRTQVQEWTADGLSSTRVYFPIAAINQERRPKARLLFQVSRVSNVHQCNSIQELLRTATFILIASLHQHNCSQKWFHVNYELMCFLDKESIEKLNRIFWIDSSQVHLFKVLPTVMNWGDNYRPTDSIKRHMSISIHLFSYTCYLLSGWISWILSSYISLWNQK